MNAKRRKDHGNGGVMKLIDQLGLDTAQREWLSLELYRRAAQNFEQVRRYRDAAECWEQAGETERAVTVQDKK